MIFIDCKNVVNKVVDVFLLSNSKLLVAVKTSTALFHLTSVFRTVLPFTIYLIINGD